MNALSCASKESVCCWGTHKAPYLQRRNRTTGSDWVAETHAYPLAAAASGVRHRGSNASIYHVAHDMYDGALIPTPVWIVPLGELLLP